MSEDNRAWMVGELQEISRMIGEGEVTRSFEAQLDAFDRINELASFLMDRAG